MLRLDGQRPRRPPQEARAGRPAVPTPSARARREVLRDVAARSQEPLLLAAPERDADRAPGLDAERLEDPDGLHRRDDAGAVVGRARARRATSPGARRASRPRPSCRCRGSRRSCWRPSARPSCAPSRSLPARRAFLLVEQPRDALPVLDRHHERRRRRRRVLPVAVVDALTRNVPPSSAPASMTAATFSSTRNLLSALWNSRRLMRSSRLKGTPPACTARTPGIS